MSSREELRRKGNEIRERLQHGSYPSRRPRATASVPGLRNFTGESIFGSVWARPGLDIRYRMLATLAVLSSLQRLSQLETYVHSALTLGLSAEEIQEALIHCNLYAGFPSTVNSLEVAHEAFRERGIEPPQTEVPEVSLEEMEARGRELREKLMGTQDRGGYTGALNDLAPDMRSAHAAVRVRRDILPPRAGPEIQGRLHHRRADRPARRCPAPQLPAGRPQRGLQQGGNDGGPDPDGRLRGLSGGAERHRHRRPGLGVRQVIRLRGNTAPPQ